MEGFAVRAKQLKEIGGEMLESAVAEPRIGRKSRHLWWRIARFEQIPFTSFDLLPVVRWKKTVILVKSALLYLTA